VNDNTADSPKTTQSSVTLPGAAIADIDVVRVRFGQYKLAVEMADRMSAKRHTSNKFFITLLSGFGAFYSLLDRLPPSLGRSIAQYVLPILPLSLCFLWRSTVLSYRKINKAKWDAIGQLEANLPSQPFTQEGTNLGPGGSFALTKLEKEIPVIIGLIFLLQAVSPLFDAVVCRVLKK